jgi:hypothetical protein
VKVDILDSQKLALLELEQTTLSLLTAATTSVSEHWFSSAAFYVSGLYLIE